MSASQSLEWLLLIPVFVGTAWAFVSLGATLIAVRRIAAHRDPPSDGLPPVSVLKPVRGLEPNLDVNLRSFCTQSYPDYEVVFCVQRADDPALPLLRSLEQEFASLVTVVVEDVAVGSNGKVNNLLGGLRRARHEILVMSDSDVRADPDYLVKMVTTLEQENVGAVCSFFKTKSAQRWYEKLESLSINADFMPNVMFSWLTGIADFFLGPSVALRRSTLRAIGGLEDLADYLVEDYEIGRRVRQTGQRVLVAPHVIEASIHLSNARDWWLHQVYWDLNLRLANPGGFIAHVIIRAIPFALLFALLRGFDPFSLGLLALVVVIRLVTSAATLWWGFRDTEGLRSLHWMPVRDVCALIFWILALAPRTVVWRGTRYRLTAGGKMVRASMEPGLS